MSTRIGLRERDDRRTGNRDGHAVDGDGGGRRFSRYDLFLAVLPLPLVCGLGWAAMTAAPLSAGVGLGSLPAALLVAYGLFIGGPSRPSAAAVEGTDDSDE